MKRIVVGTVAHVDAGKTTLSEAMLYQAGEIRHLGRVDKGNAFLDPEFLEKKRGITISSHQASFKIDDLSITLLDTPGHVDFSNQTEQVMDVLDYAILVVSAIDGVQSYTRTLWRLLTKKQIPVFIFVNKMDSNGANKNQVLSNLNTALSPNCIEFLPSMPEITIDEIAVRNEDALEEFVETGGINDKTVQKLIQQRDIFPVYFGSALKADGITDFMNGLNQWTIEKKLANEFMAKVFKISHDDQGERLTWVRVIGGTLKNKMVLDDSQKANQLRIYNGAKFSINQEVATGDVCAITGLTDTYPGQGLGQAKNSQPLTIQPVLNYAVLVKEPEVKKCLFALRQLEDENPQLNVSWSTQLQEIHVQIMGEVQLEILQQILLNRYHLDVSFGESSILYKETIIKKIEGVGHFEPLRHYAEVHLLMEPGKLNSGIIFDNNCSIDFLGNNFQQQVMTSLRAKEHVGVLAGWPLTDIKITLINGKSSIKHSVGGDFREATWRAVRQGLMMLKSTNALQLMEPWYQFRMEINQSKVGRAINDIQKMSGILNNSETITVGEITILSGTVPVSEIQGYAKSINNYTHGQGQLDCVFAGYRVCHNPTDVLADIKYDPVADLDNTPDSVFCAHGAGYPVKWNELPTTAHVNYINS